MNAKVESESEHRVTLTSTLPISSRLAEQVMHRLDRYERYTSYKSHISRVAILWMSCWYSIEQYIPLLAFALEAC